ncbi:hypothetical protein [Pontibacter arcticus]|uniref:Uncharacterized protein n=1 Tax=Pontibacter arcticus TaxID=2080288 RepID=A0A364RGP6_9BACT|nr:hypothetical protein [Pontibacter arcticus]RAU83479.1 hypothetical protein DP923_08125 [Pontibacter arcticus]
MKQFSLPIFFGILFSAVGTVSLFLTRDIMMAAIWLSFGNGLMLATFKFNTVDAAGNNVLKPVPPVRMYIGIGLMVLAVALLLLQVYFDFQNAPVKG